MNGKRSIIIVAALVLIAALGMAAPLWAAGEEPGSESDPVVSKSYVDERISYKPVMLEQGQTMIGAEGTEIILRSGEASAIDNGENGVADLTAGEDLLTGDPAGLNHLMIVPRGDGRGIKALTEIWVLVRGDYTIE